MALDVRILLMTVITTAAQADGIGVGSGFATKQHKHIYLPVLRPPGLVGVPGLPDLRGSSMTTPLPGTPAPNLSSTFDIGKMLSFMDTLSPEQRVMFEQMTVSPAPIELPVGPPIEPIEVPPSPPPALGWYISWASRATETEVRLLAVLLTIHLDKDALDAWIWRVEQDAENIALHGDAWCPPKGDAWHSTKGTILPVLKAALAVRPQHDSGGCTAIETASAALAVWTSVNISVSSIYSYLKMMTRAKPLKVPARDGGKTTSARYISAIPAVAALLRDHRRRLRDLIAVNHVHVTFEVPMTKAEIVEQMEVEREEHRQVVEEMEADTSELKEKHEEEVASLKGKVTTAQKGASKARNEAKSSKGAMKGHTARVRKEQKELRNKQVAVIREAATAEADEALKAKVKRKQSCATVAHSKKRAWRERCEAAEHLADTRSKELKKLKADNASLTHERDELMMDAEEEEEEGEARAKQLEAWARQQAMPRW